MEKFSHQVAIRAYYIWVESGKQRHEDDKNWVRAERQLRYACAEKCPVLPVEIWIMILNPPLVEHRFVCKTFRYIYNRKHKITLEKGRKIWKSIPKLARPAFEIIANGFDIDKIAMLGFTGTWRVMMYEQDSSTKSVCTISKHNWDLEPIYIDLDLPEHNYKIRHGDKFITQAENETLIGVVEGDESSFKGHKIKPCSVRQTGHFKKSSLYEGISRTNHKAIFIVRDAEKNPYYVERSAIGVRCLQWPIPSMSNIVICYNGIYYGNAKHCKVKTVITINPKEYRFDIPRDRKKFGKWIIS